MSKYDELVEASKQLRSIRELTSHPRKFVFARAYNLDGDDGIQTLANVTDYMLAVHSRWAKAVEAFDD